MPRCASAIASILLAILASSATANLLGQNNEEILFFDGSPGQTGTGNGGAVIYPLDSGVWRFWYQDVKAARISPDARQVAYYYNWNLHLADFNGQNARMIRQTSQERLVIPLLSWSPQGDRLAYWSFRADLQAGGYVNVVDLNGNRIYQHEYRGISDASPPSWSPDGREIAFRYHERPDEGLSYDSISSIDVATGERRQIYAEQQRRLYREHVSTPDWSPGGDRIAFIRTETEIGSLFGDNIDTVRYGIATVPAGGGDPTWVVSWTYTEDRYDNRSASYPGGINALTWSPDSEQLAFSIYGGSLTQGTYRVNASPGSSAEWLNGFVPAKVAPPTASYNLQWADMNPRPLLRMNLDPNRTNYETNEAVTVEITIVHRGRGPALYSFENGLYTQNPEPIEGGTPVVAFAEVDTPEPFTLSSEDPMRTFTIPAVTHSPGALNLLSALMVQPDEGDSFALEAARAIVVSPISTEVTITHKGHRWMSTPESEWGVRARTINAQRRFDELEPYQNLIEIELMVTNEAKDPVENLNVPEPRDVLQYIQSTDPEDRVVPLLPIRFFAPDGAEVDLTNPDDPTAVNDMTLQPGESATFAWVVEAFQIDPETRETPYDLEFTPLVLGSQSGVELRTTDREAFRILLRDPIVVNVDGDDADFDPGDGVIDVDPDQEGEQISLRAAIKYANETPGLDRIEFDIPGKDFATILPESALPSVTDSVEIDGTTQGGVPDQPSIGINGETLSPDYGEEDGLIIEANDCVIRGLVIGGFRMPAQTYRNNYPLDNEEVTDALIIEGGSGNLVEYCYLGTNQTGNRGDANLGYGIRIQNGYENEVRHCLISGNKTGGIGIIRSSHNRIHSNFLGTDHTGRRSYHNRYSWPEFPNLRVRRFNSQDGDPFDIYTRPSNLGNSAGEFIFDRIYNGTSEVSGAITLWQSSDNIIENNIIAGNNDAGIYVTGSRNQVFSNQVGRPSFEENEDLENLGTGIFVSGDYNEIGARGKGNTVIGNFVGIELSGRRNKIQGNVFGDAWEAMVLSEATNSYIGGTVQAEANTFTKANAGVVFAGGSYNTLDGCVIEDNITGVYATGERNLVFGKTAGNTVQNNTLSGLVISESTDGTVENNTIRSHAGTATVPVGTGIVVGHHSRNITIRKNLFHDNKANEIDLVFDPGGRAASRQARGDGRDYPPDFEDFDTGGNGKQNFPQLLDFEPPVSDGATLHLKGFLRASIAASQSFTIDFYRLPKADPRTIWVDSRELQTSLASNEFEYTLGHAFETGDYLVMTATDADGNTSEFSLPYVVEGTGDSDTDQVSDEIEGLAPNDGDGNGDSVKDSLQANVASFQSFDGAIHTLVIAEELAGAAVSSGGDASSGNEISLLGVRALAEILPRGAADAVFPQGTLRFKLSDVTPGAGVTATLYFQGVDPASFTSFWFLTAAGQWEEFTGFSANGSTVTLVLRDGGPMDLDGEDDGFIDVNIAPATSLPMRSMPDLRIERDGATGRLMVKWNLEAASNLLQCSPDLSSEHWQVIEGIFFLGDGQAAYPVPRSVEDPLKQFFRLITPP